MTRINPPRTVASRGVGTTSAASSGDPMTAAPRPARPAPSNRGAAPTYFGFGLNRSMVSDVTQADQFPSKTDETRKVRGGLNGTEDLTVSGMTRPLHPEGELVRVAASLRRPPDDNSGYFELHAASVETQAGMDTAREQGGSGTARAGSGSARPPARVK